MFIIDDLSIFFDRIVPRTNEKAYVHIDASADGCYSSLGRTGRKQEIGFAPKCSWGNLAHEFMHALGS